jgi:hypothetical protein
VCLREQHHFGPATEAKALLASEWLLFDSADFGLTTGNGFLYRRRSIARTEAQPFDYDIYTTLTEPSVKTEGSAGASDKTPGLIGELVKRGSLSERCWIHTSRASPLNRGFPPSEFRKP